MEGAPRSVRSATAVVRRAACAAAVSVAVIGCGETSGPHSEQPTPKRTVVMEDDAYHPETVRIPVGTRVTWVNRNEPVVTVETAGVAFFEYDREKLDRENKFDLHSFGTGEADSVLFDTPGRYPYGSSFDSSMTGTVIVTRESP